MMRFVPFREVNDFEGETWTFWLQLDGNEEELRKLFALLERESDRAGVDIPYTLVLDDWETEEDVDVLVGFAEDTLEGYAPAHQKVTGRFTCPDSIGEYGDDLYKGRIVEFFSNER